jgi:hypothetical protein
MNDLTSGAFGGNTRLHCALEEASEPPGAQRWRMRVNDEWSGNGLCSA